MISAPETNQTIARLKLERNGLRREIMALRSEAPECVAIVMEMDDGSLDAFLVMDLDQRPLEDLARDILDPAAQGPDRPSPPPIMARGMSSEMFRAAVTGGDCTGYSAEQCAAVLGFLRDRVPMRALEWIAHASGGTRPDRRQTESVLDWIGFFSAGDAEARTQAFWSLPSICREIPLSAELLEAVDRRTEIFPALVRKVRSIIDMELSLTPSSQAVGGLTQIPNIAKLRGPFWNPAPQLKDIPGAKDIDLDRLSVSIARKILKVERIVARSIRTGDDLAMHATGWTRNNLTFLVNMLSILRDDQIPDTLEGIDAMKKAVTTAGLATYAMQVSFGPMMRVLSRVTRDGWVDADLSIRSPESQGQQSLIRNCFSSTAHRIAGSIVVDRMTKAIGPEIMTRIMKTAEAVWARDDIPEIDAQMAKTFLAFCSSWGPAASILRELRGVVVHLLTERASMKTLEEIQVRWHHTTQRIESQVMADSGELSWSPLIGSVDLPGGLRAVELTTSNRLAEQGKREGHCVGGYAPRILASTKAEMRTVFSIEDGSGAILSTAEIVGCMHQDKSGRMSGASWKVSEHRSQKNGTPDARARKAVQDLVERLDALPVRTSAAYARMLGTNPSNLLNALQTAVSTFSLNPTNPEIPRISLDAVNEVLPKHLRGRGIEGWAQEAMQRLGVPKNENIPTRYGQKHFETSLKALAEELARLAATDPSCDAAQIDEKTGRPEPAADPATDPEPEIDQVRLAL